MICNTQLLYVVKKIHFTNIFQKFSVKHLITNFVKELINYTVDHLKLESSFDLFFFIVK